MKNHKWWNNTVFYQIYMPSFRDGNNDGIGDFKGITEKLDYIKELGVKGVWLTPFYPSPKVDNGYDISDYKNVDPDYGDFESFQTFIREAKKRNIKVIIDMVINHTSTEHKWFKESKQSKDSPKRDWYIWRDEPNNWESFFSGSAWEYDAETKQYYYHSFAKEQADLNWKNQEVIDAFKDIFDFWIEQGIDGFRLDVINNLTVSDKFKDNPVNDHGEQVHLYDKDQHGLDEVLKDLVQHIKHQKSDALLVGEISSDELDLISHYSKNDLFDLTFNFNLGSMDELNVPRFFNEVSKMSKVYLDSYMPTLFFGSHDLSRSWDRLAENNLTKYKTLLLFLLFSKGVPFIYAGEELGMRNYVPKTLEDFRDVQGVNAYRVALEKEKSEEEALELALKETRDGGRTPLDWEDDIKAGKDYWIGRSEINPLYKEVFAYYQKTIEVRNKLNLADIDYDSIEFQNEAFYFKRNGIVVYLNFGSPAEIFPFDINDSEILVKNGTLSLSDNQLILGEFSGCVIKINEENQ